MQIDVSEARQPWPFVGTNQLAATVCIVAPANQRPENAIAWHLIIQLLRVINKTSPKLRWLITSGCSVSDTISSYWRDVLGRQPHTSASWCPMSSMYLKKKLYEQANITPLKVRVGRRCIVKLCLFKESPFNIKCLKNAQVVTNVWWK